MIIDELMNPEGRGSSAFHMKIIHENLQMRFEKNIAKTIQVLAYEEKNDYFFHCRIPSESNAAHDKEIFYDVILQFSPGDKEDVTSGSIRGYKVKAFSNSPSFTFTFTRTYKTHKLLPEIIPTKLYNKLSLHKAPVVRNPLDVVGIEKTIWFAGHYLISNGFMNKNRIPGITDKKSIKSIIGKILSQDDKLVEVERRNEKAAKQRAAERKASRAEVKKEAARDRIGTSLRREKSDGLKRQSENALVRARTENLKSDLKRGKENVLKR